MILVDTSVWIDHLHACDSHLVTLLNADAVATHPLVISELALGSLAQRQTTLALLSQLHAVPVLTNDELLALVEARHLWGKGLSLVDAHLMGSCLLAPGTKLWTRDKRLASAAANIGVSY